MDGWKKLEEFCRFKEYGEMVGKEQQQIIDENFEEDVNDIINGPQLLEKMSPEMRKMAKLFYCLGFSKGVMHGTKILKQFINGEV